MKNHYLYNCTISPLSTVPVCAKEQLSTLTIFILCTGSVSYALKIAADFILCRWGGGGAVQGAVRSNYTAYLSPPLMGANPFQRPLVRLGPENINKNLVFKGSPLPTALVMDFYASKSLRPVPYSINNRYIIS
jgi:hypothetical protein